MNLDNKTNLKVKLLLLSLAVIAMGLGIGYGITKSSTIDKTQYTDNTEITKDFVSDITRSYLVEKTDINQDGVYTASVTGNEINVSPTTDFYRILKADIINGEYYTASGTTEAVTLERLPSDTYYIEKNEISTLLAATAVTTGTNLSFTSITTNIGDIYISTGDVGSGTFTKLEIVNGELSLPEGVTLTVDNKIALFNTDAPLPTAPIINGGSASSTIEYDLKDVLNAYIPFTWAKLTDDDVTAILADSSKYKFKLWVGDVREVLSRRGVIDLVTNWDGAEVTSDSVLELSTGANSPLITTNYTYSFSLTFNRTTAKITLTDVHRFTPAGGDLLGSTAINDVGGIRALQVYTV